MIRYLTLRWSIWSSLTKRRLIRRWGYARHPHVWRGR